MATKQAVEIIRDWLKALGALVAASMSTEESRGRLDAFAPILAQEFPIVTRYFTGESLRFVARQCRYFPTYAELCDHLAGWWKSRPQALQAISEDHAEGAWKAKIAEQRADAVRDWSDPAKVRSSRDLVLSSDVENLDLGCMLAGLIARHAPQNLGLLPPAWLRAALDPKP